MKTIVLTTILITALIAVDVMPSVAQSPEQLYQKGLMKEEGEGALQDAIDIYSKVADNSKADQSLQAKALLHIGMCYEKLGMQEAVKAYQRLVNNYPAQKNEVLLARERLSRLVQVADKNSEIPLLPKFTRIKMPTRLSFAAALSPDGKTLAHIADKKLWTTPLSGNIGPELPGNPVQVNTEGIEVEWTGLSWSRDGNWIAFNDIPLKNKTEKENNNQSIFIVSSGGGNPNKVIENYRDARVVNYRISLSPDGKKLAFSSVENGEQHIYLKQVDEGVPKQLADIQAREPVFSPDGKWIAFVEDKNLGRLGGSLWIVPAGGGVPRLVARAGNASSPLWSPDGSMIAYLDLTKNKQINFVHVPENGEAPRNIINVDAPDGVEDIKLLAGWTLNNRIGIMLTSEQEFSLYTLPVTGGQAAIALHDCFAYQPRFSPDGRQIFYVMYPKEKGTDRFDQGGVLASVPANGGTGKPIPGNHSGENIRQLPYQSGNRISPDGKTMISSAFTSADTTGTNEWPNSKIWRISLDGTETKQITSHTGRYADMSPSWSPDGRKVAFIRAELTDDITLYGKESIYISSSDGGEPVDLIPETIDYIFSPVWSPEGGMIAYISKEKEAPRNSYMNVINLENGEKRVVGKIPGSNVNVELAWSPDSKRIAFNDNNAKVIKVINLDDGQIEDIQTGLVDVNIYHLDWSPDGDRFVFGGFKGGFPEFWFMENFLPLEKLAQNAATPAAGISEDITVRQIWSGQGADDFGSASDDGVLLSFTEWETGNLAVRNLKTGENKLVSDDATWMDSIQYAEYSLISPDGKQFAYTWYYKNLNYQLRLIRGIGQKPVVLYSCKGWDEYVTPGVWFSDDKRIIMQVSNNKSRSMQLILFNTLSGETEVMKETAPGLPFKANLALSPDERYLAFDFPDPAANGMFDVNIISLDAKQESRIIEHPANDRLLGWLPGRNEVLFVSDRSGTKDIWAMTVSDGQLSGVPKRILNNTGDVNPMGYTLKGSLMFGVSTTVFESFIVPLNGESGKVSMDERTSIAGQRFGCTWLPDGESIIFTEFNQGPATQTRINLVVANTKTGKSRILAENLSIYGHFRISPDGKSVVALARDQQRLNEKDYRGALYIIDIETGMASEEKTSHDATRAFSCEWDREGKNIFYFSEKDLVKHNLDTGVEIVIYSARNVVYPSLTRSYDGNSILFDALKDINGDVFHLLSVPVTGGDADTLATYQAVGSARFKRMALSPDGKYIYLTTRAPGMKSVLSRIPSTGGTPENLWQSTYYFIAGLSVHPHGDRIALSTFETAREIRIIDNLDKKVTEVFHREE